MKKIALLLSVLFVFVIAGKAQPQGGPRGPMNPEDMAKRQTEKLKETLKLSADQEKKVYDINLKYAKKRSEMFKAGMQGGDRDAMREKMTQMQTEESKEMKTVLTADQYTAYEKYLEEQRQKRMQGGGGGGPR